MERDQFERIAKALADPRRFKALEMIASCEEMGCQHLCDQSEVSRPTISYHVKELTNAGLVEVRREGQFKYYRVRRDIVAEYLAEVERRVSLRSPAMKT